MPALPGSGARGVRTFWRSLSLRFALLAAASLFTHATFAAKPGPNPPPPPSNGTLVLEYLGGTGQTSGLTVAPSGTIYASGSVSGVPTDRGVVLSSSDSGATWTGPLDDFASSGGYTYYNGMASDAAGNLYVAGRVVDSNFAAPDHWIVRRSSDGGASWTTVDDFDRGGQPDGESPAIAVDAAGDVYVSDVSFVSASSVWTVRKGVGGTSFSTVDAAQSGRSRALFAHPTAGIFTAGTKDGGWTVRRSTDGGATRSNIETFRLGNHYGSHAYGIGANALGHLFVVGAAFDRTGSRWLVRKSIDGGASFSTVENFQPNGNPSKALRFSATPNGDLYVAGVSPSLIGSQHWTVRKNPGGTGSWSTYDDYQYAGKSAIPSSMAADASGNLFVGGAGIDHWLIKRY